MARLTVDSAGSHGAVVTADCGNSTVNNTAAGSKTLDNGALVASVAISIAGEDNKGHNAAVGTAGSKGSAKAAAATDRPHIEFLNGLRGLAALLVVCHHAHIMEEFVNIGGTAVDIFFVLSSFLLTMLFEVKARSMLRQRATARQWLCALLDYFSKRFLRVYPLFASVAVLLWLLPNEAKARYYTLGAPQDYDLYKVLTFDPHARFFVFWTLPLEIAYYFFIPVLVLTVCLLGRRWWLAVLPLCVWVVDEGLHVDRRPFVPLRAHLSTFVAGSLAAIIYARLHEFVKQNDAFVARNRRAVVAGVRAVQLSALALAVSLSFHGLFFNWIMPNPFEQHEGAAAFISAPVSIVLVLEILFPSTLSQLLEWKLLCYAGKVSFSMYLLHPFVLKSEWMEQRQATWYDQFFAWVVLVFALSTASYWAIEHPSQLLAQRVSGALRTWERRHAHASALPSPSKASTGGRSVGATARDAALFCRSRCEQLYSPVRKVV
jgi:peptidoglycan/LPS O-acetylase OafA/YrhL